MKNLNYRPILDAVVDPKEMVKIELLDEAYAGLIYSYGAVKVGDEVDIPESDTPDPLHLSFVYDIHHTPENVNVDEDIVKFETMLGDILVEIITEHVRMGEELK